MVLANKKVIIGAAIALLVIALKGRAVLLLMIAGLAYLMHRSPKSDSKDIESPGDQYGRPIGPEETREQKRARFMSENGDQINRFFEEHPSVIEWRGESWDSIDIIVKRPQRDLLLIGFFELSEDGEIERFEQIEGPWGRSHFTLFERKEPVNIPQEMLVAQLAGLLKDDENVAKYCDQVAATLLDEGHCVFNGPVGLRISESEYNELYYNEDWEAAWKTALSGEFQVKCVDSTEKAGCFMLTAA